MYTELEKLCIQKDKSIREGINQINQSRLGIVLIVDSEQRLLGTVTDGDIRRLVLGNVDLTTAISNVLFRKQGTPYAKPITAFVGEDKNVYLRLLQQHGILHLPIVNKDHRVVGLVSMEEFLGPPELSVQAVLMAGGAGVRLRPLTKDTPKPMLPVGNKPLIEIIVRKLRESGIKEVKISTHHEREKIASHFKDGRDFDIRVSYLNEDQPLGTAGALGLLEEIKSTLLVMNGDILTNMDFRSMIGYHREHEADVTIAVRQYDVKVPYGVVECKDHVVMDVVEKPVYNFFVNAGIYLLEPTAKRYLPKGRIPFDMTDLIDQMIKSGHTVVSYPILEQWIDIGQPEDYLQAQELVKII